MSAAHRELAGRAVRGGVVLVASRLAVQGLSWAATFLVARMLEPGDYGLMTWGAVFLGLAEFLAEAGVGRALIQKEALRPEDLDQAFSASLLLAAVLYAALFASAGGIEAWLAAPGLGLLLRVLGLTLWLLPVRTVAMAVLDREQRMGRQAAVQVVASVLQSGLVLGLAWWGAGYWALAGGVMAAKLTETASLLLAAGWRPRLAWPDEAGRALVAFGLHASGASFLWYAYSNADFAVVGRMFGEVELGHYALAFQLMSIPVQRLTASVNQVAYPVFCRLQGEPGRLRRWHLRLTVLLGFLGMPALAGLALVAGDAFPLLLTEKWVPAVVPFQLLAVTGIVMLFATTLPPLLNALGKPGIVLRYAAACCLLLPAGFVVGGWLGGVPGVCIAWLAVYPAIVAALLHLTRRVTGIGLLEFLWPQLPVVVGTLLMVAAVLLARWRLAESPALERLGACIALGAAVYAGAMLVLGRAVLRDVRALVDELGGEPMKIVAVAGARPNFMKIAPLMWEMRKRPGLSSYLVHTGQHYDEKMSRLFFEQLHIPKPDIDLGVGSGSHAVQTAEVMRKFESVLLEQRPDAVLVVGDVNSTIACGLTAVKLGVRLAHVEAGLRSFDRTMPEEINRILTDAISDWLFVTEPAGVENLRREGVDGAKIHLVGNVMIDTLLACRDRAEGSAILETLGVREGGYAVLTLHRPANVDEPAAFGRLFGAVRRLAEEVPIVFPVHPRTRRSLAAIGAEGVPGVILTEPLGYLDFMKLTAHARMVLTDSGGIQEETTVLGVPCLTLRLNTERPITCEQGTNRLVGLEPGRIVEAGLEVLAGRGVRGRVPDGWDGSAARRIVDVLQRAGG